ncbi:hypothetical protein SKAU_G00325770 [Synaphobranchus kaupii]|uniref:G-protein coupled receptors family 1 profile domain-containing protein n=1 Tax=Synaphobranchus kaupii TaxID=118154 RepID=A0A9Q1EPP6_SYNKA|nr:hypothetical protein SKAU_G00325770 [Synaphobranchus kaupii]
MHWLLEEPLVYGAHLDIACGATPGLTELLCTTGAVRLWCIADLAGPGLHASEVVASHLGVRSVRFMQTVLNRWREALTEPEWALLTDYLAGNKSDIASDPFPELSLAPDLNGLEYNGPILDFGDCEGVGMSTMKGLHPEYDELMGAFFFLIYVTTVAGNSLLVMLFFIERRLQKPMYIIMLSLAFSDIGFCTVALPKAIARYWLEDSAILFHVCIFQGFLIHYFGTLNSLIMMSMSLDRYLAICFPLRYPVLMTNRIMGALTALSWVTAVITPGNTLAYTSLMPFCGPNRIIHCYCDTL